MSSENERIALMNLAIMERLVVLSYWARQQGVVFINHADPRVEEIQYANPRVQETYPTAPPPSLVNAPLPEQSLPPPKEDEVDLMCYEDFDLIELDLGIQEMTPDEFNELVNSLF
jgi:hypothetical protein